LGLGCAIAAVLLLGWAFGQIALWWVGLVLAALYTVWFALLKRRWVWLNTSVFLAGLLAGALAIYLNASPFLAIAGAVFAAAAWEAVEDSRPVEDGNAALFERKRLLTLGLTLGAGLAVSMAGLLVSVRLPFFVLLLAALVTLFCLFKFFQLIQRGQ
jgi:hypothetical protein